MLVKIKGKKRVAVKRARKVSLSIQDLL